LNLKLYTIGPFSPLNYTNNPFLDAKSEGQGQDRELSFVKQNQFIMWPAGLSQRVKKINQLQLITQAENSLL